MSTCDAVVLSGKVLRPVTVLVMDLVKVDTAAEVCVERLSMSEFPAPPRPPLEGEMGNNIDLLELALAELPRKRELDIIPPMRLHAPPEEELALSVAPNPPTSLLLTSLFAGQDSLVLAFRLFERAAALVSLPAAVAAAAEERGGMSTIVGSRTPPPVDDIFAGDEEEWWPTDDDKRNAFT